MIATYKQLIDAWPSLHSFADDLGTSYNTAKQMRRRDSVDPGYWSAMVSGAAKRGIVSVTVTLEALAAIEAARKSPVASVACEPDVSAGRRSRAAQAAGL